MNQTYNTIDLFSGAGGMSYGFHKHNSFRISAAFDFEKGKPSSGNRLDCNITYEKNIGITPYKIDLGSISVTRFKSMLDGSIDTFIACPPCTGFSRTNPLNHLRDDERNSLVVKSAELAVAADASIIIMENARELITGNFKHHYSVFKDILESNGYTVYGKVYFLNEFGLPQIRERSIIIAVKNNYTIHTLDELWENIKLKSDATTVRRAFSTINYESDSENIHPQFSNKSVLSRIKAIPKNGGSWIDLINIPNGENHLTEGMRKILKDGKIGSYPDIYGRLFWDKPSPTIKRECSHVGNGRYAHPIQDRLCTVREMSILQGFPTDYVFGGTSLSNKYRHIGDAVPPLISFQLANIVDWIFSGRKPSLEECILPNTSLNIKDIESPETIYERAV